MKIAHCIVPITVATYALCIHLVPVSASPAHVGVSSNPQQAILKVYIQRDNAIHRYDLNAVMAFYRPDYQFTTVSGKHDSFDSLKKRLKTLVAIGMKGYTWKTSYRMENCTVKGNIATVQMKYIKRQTEFHTPKHPQYYATELAESQDEWVLTDGQWRERSAATLTERTTLSRTPIVNP